MLSYFSPETQCQEIALKSKSISSINLSSSNPWFESPLVMVVRTWWENIEIFLKNQVYNYIQRQICQKNISIKENKLKFERKKMKRKWKCSFWTSECLAANFL